MTSHTFASSRVRALVFLLTLPLAACGGGGSAPIDAPAPVSDPLAQAAETITPEEMLAHIGFLASDELRGRDTPSPGLETAARYIVDEFRRMGLEGGAGDGEFIQRYPFPLVGIDTGRVGLTLSGGDNAPELHYGADYLVGAGAAQSVSAPLVYVGRTAEWLETEPAAGSLAGRLPVTYLPGPFTRDLVVSMNRAGAAARQAGAEAIVFVLSAEVPEVAFAQLRSMTTTPRRTLGGLTGSTLVLMRQSSAEDVFRAAGMALEGPAGTAGPVPMGGLRATLVAPLNVVSEDDAPNVVAILRGSDPELADEYVVFSAHMDHVGVGRPDASGDSIYNGADDNGTGTAALLEVAEAFSNLLQRPARSLVFLAVSGEEKGLLGSRWFSDHPTIPLEDVVANINVDMIGRNAPDSIVVIGQEYSSLGPTVHAVAAANPGLGLTVSEDLWPEERFFFRSDHFNFARKEVPALFFFAGVHDDYHQPSDHVDLIDGDKVTRVARLIFLTAHAIADSPTAPSWTEEGLEEIRALTAGGR